jgi:predicted MFS family arabinose efflux permease
MLNSPVALYRNAYAGLATPVWWISLVMLVNRAGTMVIPFLTVYLTTELNFTIAQAGLIMGMFGAGSILGAFIGGKLTDRIGFYAIQFWSLFLNGIFFIILGQMHTMLQFGICIFMLSAVGEGFRPANGAAIAFYSKPENRTRSYSLNRLAANLGWSIGPATGGILAGISYQLLFWVDGFSCIIAAILLRICLRPVKVTEPKKKVRKIIDPAASAYRDKIYLRFMFLVFLVAICFLQMFSILPLYYKEVIHMKESTIGMVIGMNGLIIAAIEMVLIYTLEGKRNMYHYMSFGAFLIGLAYLLFNIGGGLLPMVFISMIVITFGEMFLFPFINTFWVSRSKEHNRGQYAGLYTIAFASANVVAPTLGSQVVNLYGFDVWWYVVFAICFVAAICFYLLRSTPTN